MTDRSRTYTAETAATSRWKNFVRRTCGENSARFSMSRSPLFPPALRLPSPRSSFSTESLARRHDPPPLRLLATDPAAASVEVDLEVAERSSRPEHARSVLPASKSRNARRRAARGGWTRGKGRENLRVSFLITLIVCGATLLVYRNVAASRLLGRHAVTQAAFHTQQDTGSDREPHTPKYNQTIDTAVSEAEQQLPALGAVQHTAALPDNTQYRFTHSLNSPVGFALEVHTHIRSGDSSCRLHNVCRSRNGSTLFVHPRLVDPLGGTVGNRSGISVLEKECHLGVQFSPIDDAFVEHHGDGNFSLTFMPVDLLSTHEMPGLGEHFFWDIIPVLLAIDAAPRMSDLNKTTQFNGNSNFTQLRSTEGLSGLALDLVVALDAAANSNGTTKSSGPSPGYQTAYYSTNGVQVQLGPAKVETLSYLENRKKQTLVMEPNAEAVSEWHGTWIESFLRTLPLTGAVTKSSNELYKDGEDVSCFRSITIPSQRHNLRELRSDSESYFTFNDHDQSPSPRGSSRVYENNGTKRCAVRITLLNAQSHQVEGLGQFFSNFQNDLSKLVGTVIDLTYGTLNTTRSFEKQVSVLRGSDIIIGPTTDEMVKILLARPLTLAVEVTPFGILSRHYDRLGRSAGLRYRRLPALPSPDSFAACVTQAQKYGRLASEVAESWISDLREAAHDVSVDHTMALTKSMQLDRRWIQDSSGIARDCIEMQGLRLDEEAASDLFRAELETLCGLDKTEPASTKANK